MRRYLRQLSSVINVADNSTRKQEVPLILWIYYPPASPSFSHSYQERSTQSSFAQTESEALVPPPALAKSELHQYIPEELMKKLQAARERGGMVGERRVVTMLFCDLKGSTAAAEGLDPEDWTEIMNGAFAHMIKPV